MWTIGYGHTAGVHEGQVITEAQAESLLRSDLITAELYLSEIRQIDTQGKFDACVDFCFNLGIDAFKKSTLLRCILCGCEADVIRTQFLRWNKSKEKVLKGLTKRREWEAEKWT